MPPAETVSPYRRQIPASRRDEPTPLFERLDRPPLVTDRHGRLRPRLRPSRVALVRNRVGVRTDLSRVPGCLGQSSCPTLRVTPLITMGVARPEATARHEPEIEQRKFQLHGR